MAERSFVNEVKKLRSGAGEEFHGEGILAVTKALLQSGVAYVGGYQGAPISHLLDVLNDANDILEELGVHFESSSGEATAAASLGASVNYPLRGAVAWKSTVGTNVASDALANLASGGVLGGALIVVGEDYGEGSSIMQERTHAFAMKSQFWLLDPRPNLTSIVDMVEKGFELSEASSTPVMLQLRIRACHVHGKFIAKDNQRPPLSLRDALERPDRDTGRIVLPPATFAHEKEKVENRWPAAQEFIRKHELNEVFDGPEDNIGLILQGGLYNSVIRALEKLGLADSYGECSIPMYVLNVTYPLVDDEVRKFCASKRAVLLIEEGQPDFLEQALHSILRKGDLQTRLFGKDVLPMAGEYTAATLMGGMKKFLGSTAPHLLAEPEDRLEGVEAEPLTFKPEAWVDSSSPAKFEALGEVVPARPPGFCTGCPERPIFTAMKLVEKDLGPRHVSADIGCHLFSILPPFNIGHTTMGYGLGGAGATAFNVPDARRTISVMGDGGFWHNGLTTGVTNAIFNEYDSVLLIIDNGYSAATGGQDIPSSHASVPHRNTGHSIEEAVRGVGAKWVRTLTNTYDLDGMQKTLREALTTEEKGPKIIIAQSECMLNLERREKPKRRERLKKGTRVVQNRFGVDSDTCTGDKACIRLSGCPSLSVKPNPDPLRPDPVTYVKNSCVGCGLCGEVAHAAVLCPSFYRAQIVSNPNWKDQFFARWRGKFIGALQRLSERRLAKYAV